MVQLEHYFSHGDWIFFLFRSLQIPWQGALAKWPTRPIPPTTVIISSSNNSKLHYTSNNTSTSESLVVILYHQISNQATKRETKKYPRSVVHWWSAQNLSGRKQTKRLRKKRGAAGVSAKEPSGSFKECSIDFDTIAATLKRKAQKWQKKPKMKATKSFFVRWPGESFSIFLRIWRNYCFFFKKAIAKYDIYIWHK